MKAAIKRKMEEREREAVAEFKRFFAAAREAERVIKPALTAFLQALRRLLAYKRKGWGDWNDVLQDEISEFAHADTSPAELITELWGPYGNRLASPATEKKALKAISAAAREVARQENEESD